jgi:hypothetical protein
MPVRTVARKGGIVTLPRQSRRLGDEERKIVLSWSSLSGRGYQLRRALAFPISTQPS